MLQLYVCILHRCINERYFEFQEQEVKLGQLEYNLVKLIIE